MKKIPEPEISRRIEALKSKMEDKGVDLALILQNVDRFYFTGTMQNGVLFLPLNDEPVLFVIRDFDRAKEESPIERVERYDGTRSIKRYIEKKHVDFKRVGFEYDTLPVNLFLKLKSLFPDAEHVDISNDIREIRSVKSELEIEFMKEAAKRLDEVVLEIKPMIKPGIEEFDLLPEFAKLITERESNICVRSRQYNMEAAQRYILSGKSMAKGSYMDSPSAGGYGVSVAFPGGSGHVKIEEDKPVMIDIVMNYEGYNVDCTRVFGFNRLQSKFIEAHEVSIECHSLFKRLVQSGTEIKNIYHEVRRYVEKSGLLGNFMGGVKFIGHGIGLELDEFPFITERFEGKIKDSTTVAFEPKFIFEDGGVGVENTYLFKNGKLEALNKLEEGIVII